ncbi:MAG: FAD-dependent oxidoreductase, partial [Rhodobacter sp.]|nr:FAD-dependent oxidoreductase [Rhodobacter sp.]
NAKVTAIQATAAGVRVETPARNYDADQVIVTVPVSILQAGEIGFAPRLPTRMVRGLNGITFGKGFKVFLKFRERFYPDLLLTQSVASGLVDSWDNKTYYDAAFGKGSDDHVLGLFTTNGGALPRARLSRDELVADVVAELDRIYDVAPSKLLQRAEVRNWSQDHFIRGTYSMAFDDSDFDALAEIFPSLEGRVHFAGEALGGDAQSTVHGAALSARRVVDALLGH